MLEFRFQISLKFIPMGPIDNKWALARVVACRRTGDKPLPERKFISLKHTCGTRGRWVNTSAINNQKKYGESLYCLDDIHGSSLRSKWLLDWVSFCAIIPTQRPYPCCCQGLPIGTVLNELVQIRFWKRSWRQLGWMFAHHRDELWSSKVLIWSSIAQSGCERDLSLLASGCLRHRQGSIPGTPFTNMV